MLMERSGTQAQAALRLRAPPQQFMGDDRSSLEARLSSARHKLRRFQTHADRPWAQGAVRMDQNDRPSIERRRSKDRKAPLRARKWGSQRKVQRPTTNAAGCSWCHRMGRARSTGRRRIIDESERRSRTRGGAFLMWGLGGGRSRRPHHSACRSVHGLWMCGSIL